ncbi:MAG: IclR family transcriptional regulator [Gammaproteobacteria bacterium]|nr:IclR family transcriptional regulator [Gammaproteobacteria bacterium]MDH3447855.1 IclR family transcriptional regulator [Gammaproteobacteria bacterium]
MMDKSKQFSVVENSGRESETGLTDHAERYEQLAGLGVTGKAFSVLEVVSLNPEATRMAEIIRGTGMTKPTAHRVVNMLLEMGFLQRDGFDSGFIEGAGLVDLAHRTLAAAAPRSLRHSILQGISEQVGETVNYGVLSGGEVIYLDRVEAKWPLGLRFDAGSRVPAHCTAVGKLLLSRMPDSDLRTLIESIPRPAYTANTITAVEPLLSALTRIRRDGIGTDDQEFMHGVVCVSVPVVDDDQRCFGGIAISAPEARMTLTQMLTYVPQMRKAAGNLAATYRRSATR